MTLVLFPQHQLSIVNFLPDGKNKQISYKRHFYQKNNVAGFRKQRRTNLQIEDKHEDFDKQINPIENSYSDSTMGKKLWLKLPHSLV